MPKAKGELSSLERFTKLANFVAELGDFGFDPLVLLRISPIVLELHGVLRNVVRIIVLVRLAATTVIAVLVLAAEHKAVAAAQGRGYFGRLIVSQHGEL